jgi:signal transduction histidine kinase/ligand-binding sensor domain-containing protein
MGREQPKKPNLDKSCHRRRFRAISRRYAQAFYETNVQLIMYGGSRRRASAGMSLSALLCFLGFFVDVNPVWAVDPNRHISQYAHNAWTIQDGYLPGIVNSIAQTEDGYLWIGTSAGLVRFDGIRLIPWDAPGEPSAFSSSEITALLGSRDGSIWIAARTSRTKQNLSHWTSQQLVNIPVESTGIWSILESRSGAVWIPRPFCQVIGTGLHCYGRADGSPFDHGASLAEDTAGNLWVGGDIDIVRWKPGSSSVYAPIGLKSNRGIDGVDALAAADDGSVWAGMNQRGPDVGLQHLVQGQWKPWVTSGFDSSDLSVAALLMDRQGALWVGTNGQGIHRIYQDKVEHFRNADGLSSDNVFKLYEDREGNVWAATGKGIDRFRDLRVATYSAVEGLCSSEVDSVLAAHDGTLWIGGDRALGALRQDHLSCVATGKGLPGNQVTSLFEDHEHRLWIGIDNSLTVYEKGGFTPINRRDGTGLGLVAGIAEDAEHSIWVVTAGRRRELIRIADRIVQKELEAPQIPAPHNVAADLQGGIWLGLMNGDLARFRDGRMDTFHFNRAVDSPVAQLSISADGAVLGATASGLIGWKNGKSQSLTGRNGLPCDAVNAFITDDKGTLWLYMRCGLAAIANTELQKWWDQPEAKLQLRVFDALDGVQPGLAPFQGSARTTDGRLWFANGSMLQMIDPGRLANNAVAPLVHVENVIADQKRYAVGTFLRFPPTTRNLEIDYTAPAFAIPQKVRFRYRLEGHDAGWQEPGTRRQAFYSDLRPGRYRFQVIACNEDGVWNEVGATLDFSVAPAWYQTIWFLVACILVGLLTIWTVYRMRVRQVARALGARFDERLAERTRIARDLHDTLLQTIQGSKLVVDDALERPDDVVRVRRAVEQLSHWLRRAIQEGRTALNSLREPTTQSNDLAEALKRATEERQIQDPRMEVHFSVVGNPRELHPLVRHEVYHIGDETIRNAWTHSKGSRLEIELKYSSDLVLRVSDDGIGIDSTVLSQGKKGHFGLQGMRERVGRIGGKLTVASSGRAGTEVTVIVPGRVSFRKPRNGPLESVKTILRGRGRRLR